MAVTELLTLSKDRAVCKSTYPEWDYDTIAVTIPEAMTGAAFESVTLTYTGSQTSGTATVKFDDTRQDVTEARILKRLQDGDTAFTLLFSFRSASGERTKTWSNVQIAVSYTPAARLSGTQTADDGSTVFWAIDTGSLALGETIPVRLSVTPVKASASVTIYLSGVGQSTALSRSHDMPIGAGRTAAAVVDFTAAQTYSMSSRVMQARIAFDIVYADGTYAETAFAAIDLNLVRERTAPVVSTTVTDLSTAYAAVGAYVQGISKLRITATITLDTAADPLISIRQRTLTIDGTEYEMAGDSVEIPTDALQGTLTRTLAVTDSYGKTTTRAAQLVIQPYAPPRIDALTLERYAVTHPSTGGTQRVPDDGSPLVSIKLLKYFTYWVNGRNAYTLTATWDGGSKQLYGGSDGEWNSEINDDWYTLSDISFSPTREYVITFTLTDSLGGVATATYTLPKAGGILDIEKGGVAVGKRVTGTEAEPLFECAYPAHFEQGIYDGEGNPLGGVNYVFPETRIGSYLGKPLYRKGVEIDTYSSTSANTTTVDMGITPTRITAITGYVKTLSYGDLPLNCYHSSSIRAFCRPDGLTGRLLGYCGSSNAGAVIFVEYTKE